MLDGVPDGHDPLEEPLHEVGELVHLGLRLVHHLLLDVVVQVVGHLPALLQGGVDVGVQGGRQVVQPVIALLTSLLSTNSFRKGF